MEELELYLHIPFCVQKCAYCDFLSHTPENGETEAYVKALTEEIASYKNAFDSCKVSTVFFGGGTPSLLTPEQMSEILDGIRTHFQLDDTAEITMELNPGTATRERLTGYRKAGVNRLSIGLQSVHDNELKLLGRIHDYQTFLKTYQAARKAGFENINVDLISAIPGQSVESWEESLRMIADLRPEHLSAYSLIIEEGTTFYELYGDMEEERELEQTHETKQKEEYETEQKRKEAETDGNRMIGQPGYEESDKKQMDGEENYEGSCEECCGKRMQRESLPTEEEERLMYERTREILAKYGYQQYEISNYAQPGYECRHNLGYWERVPYLGLGVGASSLIRYQGKEYRFSHVTDVKEYLKLAKEPKKLTRDVEEVDRQAQIEEFMFLGLRKRKGIEKSEFHKRFGAAIEDLYRNILQKQEAQGLIRMEGDRICLTDRGMDLSNYVFADYLME